MLGWSVFFFIAALLAAAFGFGGIASAFGDIAVILFWVFVVLFVLSLVFSAFSRSHGHSVASGGKTVALLGIAAAVGIIAYAWMRDDWTAERLGRSIDQNTAELTQEIGDGLDAAGERTEDFVANTADAVRDDTSQALDNASDEVADDGTANVELNDQGPRLRSIDVRAPARFTPAGALFVLLLAAAADAGRRRVPLLVLLRLALFLVRIFI